MLDLREMTEASGILKLSARISIGTPGVLCIFLSGQQVMYFA